MDLEAFRQMVAKKLALRQAQGRQRFEGNNCWRSPLNVAKR
jgi:hypothetical protein